MRNPPDGLTHSDGRAVVEFVMEEVFLALLARKRATVTAEAITITETRRIITSRLGFMEVQGYSRM